MFLEQEYKDAGALVKKLDQMVDAHVARLKSTVPPVQRVPSAMTHYQPHDDVHNEEYSEYERERSTVEQTMRSMITSMDSAPSRPVRQNSERWGKFDPRANEHNDTHVREKQSAEKNHFQDEFRGHVKPVVHSSPFSDHRKKAHEMQPRLTPYNSVGQPRMTWDQAHKMAQQQAGTSTGADMSWDGIRSMLSKKTAELQKQTHAAAHYAEGEEDTQYCTCEEPVPVPLGHDMYCTCEEPVPVPTAAEKSGNGFNLSLLRKLRDSSNRAHNKVHGHDRQHGKHPTGHAHQNNRHGGNHRGGLPVEGLALQVVKHNHPNHGHKNNWNTGNMHPRSTMPSYANGLSPNVDY